MEKSYGYFWDVKSIIEEAKISLGKNITDEEAAKFLERYGEDISSGAHYGGKGVILTWIGQWITHQEINRYNILKEELYNKDIRELDKFQERLAAEGIVIAYGDSDDLLEFRGALYDEAGAFHEAGEHTEVRIIRGADNVLDIFNERDNRETMEYNKYQIEQMNMVKAFRCPSGIDAAWKIESDISHTSFNITEDGELFCRGIMFFAYDVKRLK